MLLLFGKDRVGGGERERNGSSVRPELLVSILWTLSYNYSVDSLVLPFQAVHFCVIVFKIFVREE